MMIGGADNQLMALRRVVLQWTDASLPDDLSYAGPGHTSCISRLAIVFANTQYMQMFLCKAM